MRPLTEPIEVERAWEGSKQILGSTRDTGHSMICNSGKHFPIDHRESHISDKVCG